MSWLYITVTWVAALVVADDMGLGNIHPARGAFIMLALVWNTAYTVYKWEKRAKKHSAFCISNSAFATTKEE